MHKIKIGKDINIDLDKLIESRMLVQANSGGGKSWALRRFIEQSFGKKQIIIIDPEGEFGNMRSKFDFVYIGKGGDAPAEPRSAQLLARRLLETKANAIIDIYELGSSRGEFVKVFFNAVVNMPKELWTDCFFILDEAHKFAPEKGQGESVALSSVIDMASLGRKRGFCLIPATQRPAKLSKDVVAECNNKLIGRASLDIDRERSAKELGFRTKEDILSLRDLSPGEFYVFGPAIINEVTKTTIGDVDVKPPKRGTGRSLKIAPPTAKVKKWLAELADLPQEAEKEAKTVKELKAQIVTLKRVKPTITECKEKHISNQELVNIIQKNVHIAEAKMEKKFLSDIKNIFNKIEQAKKILPNSENYAYVISPARYNSYERITRETENISHNLKVKEEKKLLDYSNEQEEKPLTGGALRMLQVLVSRYPIKLTKTQLGSFSKMKPTSGTFGTYISLLRTQGLIEIEGDLYTASQKGIEQSGETPNAPRDTEENIEMWEKNLSGKTLKMFQIITQRHPNEITKAELGELLPMSPTSGTFGTYLSILRANKLIEVSGDIIRLSEELFID